MNAINCNRYKLPALAACLFYFTVPASAEPLDKSDHEIGAW